MGERVVVTGAQGFLGRWVVAELLHGDADIEVIGLGRSTRRSRSYTATVSRGPDPVAAPLPAGALRVESDPRYDYRQVDLADASAVDALLGSVRPDIVVHSAAALRDEAWSHLSSSNIVGTATLIEAIAARVPKARLVLVSSGSVYGAADRVRLREVDRCRPLDDYAMSKYFAEGLARIAAGRHGVAMWTARVFNLVGPGLQERHLAASLAAQLTAIALGAVTPALRVGDLVTTRDYVDVRDAASAVALLARRPPPRARNAGEAARQATGVVNVGSGRETPVQCVFDGIRAATAARRALPPIEVTRLPGRPADVARSVADTTRLRALGHQPAHSLSASLEAMVDYYVDQVFADPSPR